MRKFLLSSMTVLAMSGSAMAGGLAPTVEPVDVIETKPASSVSPLLVIGLLILVGVLISRNDDNEPVAAESDIRLKSDITRVGTAANGLPLYHFRYSGLPTVYEGVMAQDVLSYKPEAIVILPFGYMAVNYDMLGMKMKVVN